jgi:thiamine-phosphate pyrophosphorylase
VIDPTRLRLYLVTDGARDVGPVVRAAVAGGVTAVQLRDPTATGRQLREAAAALLDVLAGTGVPLIVDDRLDVALAAGAQGTHLGQHDLPVEDARRLAGPDHLLGWSAADEAEMAPLTGWPAGTVDYLGVGPVTATPTKPDAGRPIGLDGLARACRLTTLPCVAIGGIDAGNAGDAMAAGAAGVAVVSAICAAADPERAAAELAAAVGVRR